MCQANINSNRNIYIYIYVYIMHFHLHPTYLALFPRLQGRDVQDGEQPNSYTTFIPSGYELR